MHYLCAALVRAGHEVDVYTTNVDGIGVSDVPVDEPVWRDGVRVRYFSCALGRRLYRSPTMATALQAHATSFDAIHAHAVFLWPTSAAAAIARRTGVPYIISPRGMLVGDLIRRKSRWLKSAWISAFERRNLLGAAAVHVTSELEAVEIGRLGLKVERFALAANGLDLGSDFEAVSQFADSQQQPEPGGVVCLGRISWKKGLDRLIAAMPFAPHARLTIVGNDEENYLPSLKTLADRLGVADRVAFLGPVFGYEKWRLIRNAEIFALCSHSENFGNAVLEAMACGVPVVVTPEVGLAGVIANAGAGLVVEGDAPQIGAAIADLLAAPDLRARMGVAGRETVQAHFSWDAIASTMAGHYFEAAAAGRRAASGNLR